MSHILYIGAVVGHCGAEYMLGIRHTGKLTCVYMTCVYSQVYVCTPAVLLVLYMDDDKYMHVPNII